MKNQKTLLTQLSQVKIVLHILNKTQTETHCKKIFLDCK